MLQSLVAIEVIFFFFNRIQMLLDLPATLVLLDIYMVCNITHFKVRCQFLLEKC
jgi:hypothetical protein